MEDRRVDLLQSQNSEEGKRLRSWQWYTQVVSQTEQASEETSMLSVFADDLSVLVRGRS